MGDETEAEGSRSSRKAREGADRRRRLGEALRTNLKRRKRQRRGRAGERAETGGEDDDPEP